MEENKINAKGVENDENNGFFIMEREIRNIFAEEKSEIEKYIESKRKEGDQRPIFELVNEFNERNK